MNQFANKVHGRPSKGPAVKSRERDADDDLESDNDIGNPGADRDPTDRL
jgi:hypothetical protein